MDESSASASTSVVPTARQQGSRRLDRDAVLTVAGDLLDAHGAAAVTVREVARLAQISVQGVYTLFGSKPGLCEALFVQGFAQLQVALDQADEVTDPTEAVVHQVKAYRAAARARPHRYALMFARPIPDFVPSTSARTQAQSTLASLEAALRRVLPAEGPPPERAALIVWALNHGLLSLEVDGVLPGDDENALEEAVRALLRSWT